MGMIMRIVTLPIILLLVIVGCTALAEHESESHCGYYDDDGPVETECDEDGLPISPPDDAGNCYVNVGVLEQCQFLCGTNPWEWCPVSIPQATATPIPTSTPRVEATSIPRIISTATSRPRSTATPLPTSTSTPVPTSTATAIPVSTSTPRIETTPTLVSTVIIIPSPTLEVTATMVPAPIETPTSEPIFLPDNSYSIWLLLFIVTPVLIFVVVWPLWINLSN